MLWNLSLPTIKELLQGVSKSVTSGPCLVNSYDHEEEPFKFETFQEIDDQI